QSEEFGFGLETGAKDLGIERIFETEAHESRVIVFDIHVELAGIADEKVENLAVIGELPARQDDLIRTFLVELAQPGGSFVGIHGLYTLSERRSGPFFLSKVKCGFRPA